MKRPRKAAAWPPWGKRIVRSETMTRLLRPVSILFLSMSIGGCTSSQQRLQEQQELERSIQKTSNPDAVKGCSFIMKLRPDGLHTTPEAQAASLVIAKEGVSWVVYGSADPYELYSCSRKTSRNDREATAPTLTPVESNPAAATSAPGRGGGKEAAASDQDSRSDGEKCPQDSDHQQPGSRQGVQVPGELRRFRERPPLSGGRREGGRKRRLRRGHETEWRRHRRVLSVLGDGGAIKATRRNRPRLPAAGRIT